jgi:hypothetical protein
MAFGVREGEGTPFAGLDAPSVALTFDQPMGEHSQVGK